MPAHRHHPQPPGRQRERHRQYPKGYLPGNPPLTAFVYSKLEQLSKERVASYALFFSHVLHLGFPLRLKKAKAKFIGAGHPTLEVSVSYAAGSLTVAVKRTT